MLLSSRGDDLKKCHLSRTKQADLKAKDRFFKLGLSHAAKFSTDTHFSKNGFIENDMLHICQNFMLA